MSIPENNPGENEKALPGSDPDDPKFTPEVLDKTVIAIPLLKDIASKGGQEEFDVIIDVNLRPTVCIAEVRIFDRVAKSITALSPPKNRT